MKKSNLKAEKILPYRLCREKLRPYRTASSHLLQLDRGTGENYSKIVATPEDKE